MDEKEKSFSIEVVKMRFDFFKHLTTLSTASAIAVASAAQGLIESPKLLWALALAMILLLFSVGGSVFGMAFKCKEAQTLKSLQSGDHRDSLCVNAIALLGFFGGLALAVYFLCTNLTSAL